MLKKVLSILRMKIEWHYQNKWYPFYYTYFNANKIGIDSRCKYPIIISLTTIPSRLPKIHLVIERLLRQTVKPQRIILYLNEENGLTRETLHLSIRKNLDKIIKRGVEIKWVPNLNCHTKYYFTLKENPESIIITVDDDGWYDLNLVAELVKSYEKHPNAVSSIRVHKIRLNAQGIPLPYSQWDKDYDNEDAYIPSLELFATGCGGVLYPPHVLDNRVLDEKLLKKLSFRADDVWLKTMEILKNTPVVKASKKRMTSWTIKSSQNVSLNSDNVGSNKNDEFISNCWTYFNLSKYFNEK